MTDFMSKPHLRIQTWAQINVSRIQCVNDGTHYRFELGYVCVDGVYWVSYAGQTIRQISKHFSRQNTIRVRLDNTTDCLQLQISHDLLKDESVRVHPCPQQMRSSVDAPRHENYFNPVQTSTRFI